MPRCGLTSSLARSGKSAIAGLRSALAGVQRGPGASKGFAIGCTRQVCLGLAAVGFLALFSEPTHAGTPAGDSADDDRIWSGIVLATQADKPKAAPSELQRVAPRIERFFGYNQLELIGSATKNVDEACERWLVPSQHFWLCVKAKKGANEHSYTLHTTLFHDQKSIVETDAKLGRDMPLLIRGPMHARGQLLIILQLVK